MPTGFEELHQLQHSGYDDNYSDSSSQAVWKAEPHCHAEQNVGEGAFEIWVTQVGPHLDWRQRREHNDGEQSKSGNARDEGHCRS